MEEETRLEDINSYAMIFYHEKSGALIIFKNDDDNKVFSVTFRTPPEDNAG